jgi:hypothetical protein
MNTWISPATLSKGLNDLPPIKISTQNHLRSQRKLKYTKIGKEVMYKKEWVLEYIDTNIRETQVLK